ncbi:TetR/AcrR family transcriptional regulator [Aldersonia sp. NBC_00410]|jgi:TetR/AcrR family transcriptional regulator, repressor for uid operon|uniref:TetR/AcrR family transcriptional regulator n=1 Tax=Aldersonia sp. NBC_00410 TaxID=2975954 RepID=UPI0022556A4B|nr:TetR/AcrR family transcriptional regulator [Aldersonia sp. NBC_00410]MCX5045721.1 TetR/AcrR family transcriptional regulator [Aldersonia sp. NBC_00410]
MESAPASGVRVTAPQPMSLLERAYTNAVERSGDLDETRERLLDAAYEQFCRLGIQRTSMEEVARGAGLSRITLYRKFDTKDALVEQLIIREFRRYLDQFLDDIKEADTVADRVVVGFVASIRAIGGNPLIGGLLETELTLVVGSIIKKDSGMLSTVQEFVAGQLRREQQVGNISGDVDADLVAEMMVRISASFLTVPSRIVDITDDVQLATVARKFLVPMLAAPPAG